MNAAIAHLFRDKSEPSPEAPSTLEPTPETEAALEPALDTRRDPGATPGEKPSSGEPLSPGEGTSDEPTESAAEASEASTERQLSDRLARDLHRLSLLRPRTEAEMRAYCWQNEILPRVRDAGFGERFLREITGPDRPGREEDFRQWQSTLDQCERLCVGNGAIVVLAGARGTGKTTICAQMAIRRAWDESRPPWDRQPPYRKLQDVIERYKPLYSDFGSIETEDLIATRESYCTLPSLVFIDEIHVVEGMRAHQRMLVDLIDRRYAARRDTVLITNQEPDVFIEKTDPSILSRIREHGLIIACRWGTWRTGEETVRTAKAATPLLAPITVLSPGDAPPSVPAPSEGEGEETSTPEPFPASEPSSVSPASAPSVPTHPSPTPDLGDQLELITHKDDMPDSTHHRTGGLYP